MFKHNSCEVALGHVNQRFLLWSSLDIGYMLAAAMEFPPPEHLAGEFQA